VWRYDAREEGATGFHGNPALIRKLVVVQSDGSKPTIYAFDQKTGAVAWRFDSGKLNFSFDILVAPPNIVALVSQGLVAIDPQTGKKVWQYDLTPAAFISPVTDGARVFAASSDGSLYAVDAWTGKLLWKTALRGSPSSSVAATFVDGSLYVGASETSWDDPWSTALPGKHTLYRVNPESGTIEGSIALPAKALGRLIRSNDVVVVYAGNTLLGLTADLKTVVWKQSAVHNSKTPRVRLMDREIAFAPSDPKSVIALRVASGEVMWQESLPGSLTTLESSGDNLYVGIAGGRLIAYKIVVK